MFSIVWISVTFLNHAAPAHTSLFWSSYDSKRAVKETKWRLTRLQSMLPFLGYGREVLSTISWSPGVSDICQKTVAKNLLISVISGLNQCYLIMVITIMILSVDCSRCDVNKQKTWQRWLLSGEWNFPLCEIFTNIAKNLTTQNVRCMHFCCGTIPIQLLSTVLILTKFQVLECWMILQNVVWSQYLCLKCHDSARGPLHKKVN